jgi:hypothetical protein
VGDINGGLSKWGGLCIISLPKKKLDAIIIYYSCDFNELFQSAGCIKFF